MKRRNKAEQEVSTNTCELYEGTLAQRFPYLENQDFRRLLSASQILNSLVMWFAK